MTKEISENGLYFDEVDKICILEPEVYKQTNDLKDQCNIYLESKC